MSPRHSSNAEPVLSSQALDRVLANPRVREHLWQVGQNIVRSADVPYLAGYSQDGKTIYIDRNLPDRISYEDDGQRRIFDADRFLLRHERLEKTLIDVLGWTYWPAHSAANGYERRGVVQELGPGAWPHYERCMMPFVKADEREKLTKVPRDLDMTPYWAPPVDKALIAWIQEAQGKEHLYSKLEVSYSDRGSAKEHCGQVSKWPRGACKNFEKPHACRLVRGFIEPAGWCKKWESRGG